MPSVTCEFSIAGKTGSKLAPNSIGVELPSPEEVEEIGSLTGFPVAGWDRGSVVRRKIQVCEPEDSARLQKLLDLILAKIGFVPSTRKIIPRADIGHVFGLIRHREYSLDELDASEFLSITHVNKIIADFLRGTEDDIDAERYLVKNGRKKKNVSMGVLSPFPAIAVSGELKSGLEQRDLIGLEFDLIPDSEDLWKPTSSV